MLLRTVSGLLGLAILLTAIWAGLFWAFLLTLLAAILGVREFYRLHPPASAEPEPGSPEDVSPIVDAGDAEQSPAAHMAPQDFGRAGSSAINCGKPGTSDQDEDFQRLPRLSQAATEGPQVPAPLESSAVSVPVEETSAPPATPLPALLGAAWVAAFVIAGAGAGGTLQFWGISLGILGVGSFIALLWLIAFYRGTGWPVAAAYLALGPVYVGFLLAHVMLLAQMGEAFFELDPLYFDPVAGPAVYEVGRNWVIFALLVNSATDSGAYLVGRAIGRHPMAPVTSPNKTWEGAAGGFACAIVAAFLLDRILDLGFGPNALDGAWVALNWQPLLIGATVGVVSQFGDLLESRLKRVSQVKDSGALIPGHGGMLDRLDSLLITFPTVYYLLVAVLRL